MALIPPENKAGFIARCLQEETPDAQVPTEPPPEPPVYNTKKAKDLTWGYTRSIFASRNSLSWQARTNQDSSELGEMLSASRRHGMATPEPTYSKDSPTYVGPAVDGPYAGQELQSATLTRFGYEHPDDDDPVGRYDFDLERKVWAWTPHTSDPEFQK